MRTLPYLHHELIIQILLRLPVKSLIQFKCVCKSWFSFISDSYFANSHFQLTATTHTRRILSIFVSPLEIRTLDFESSLSNGSASLNFKFSLPRSYFPVEIRGSCRGLILLHSLLNFYYLWNPSTGFHKQIPLSPFYSTSEAYHFDHLYGFGYDQSRDDYLVLSFSYGPIYHSSHLEFFSLRDNTWKEIEMEGTQFPYVSASYNPKVGLLFNGAIHWLAYRYDLSVYVIVAFDLTERKVLDMPLPKYFNHRTQDCGLWVFGEFLSIWDMEGYDNTIKIWVMKEYNLHSSWTKTLVRLIDDAISDFSPICYTKNGDIIGTDGGPGLVKYNDKGKLLEYRSYYNNSVRSKVTIYTESLLSLPSDGVQV